ncbi:MAG: hypothetical protein ACRYFE_09105 [Janthinobacterium lividum]
MKFRVAAAVAIAAGLVSAGNAAAQSNSLMLEANVAEASDVTGAELGIGWSLKAGNFRLAPAVGAFIFQGDNDRYRMYDQSNGARCRDTTNGQYARTELCDDTAVEAYGRLEATAQWRSVELGVGYRVSEEESAPYGIIAFKANDRIAIKGNLGSDYIGAGLSLRTW